MKSLEERHLDQLKQGNDPSNCFICEHCGGHVYANKCICYLSHVKRNKEQVERTRERTQSFT